jgi:hypothetical protein
VADAEQQRDRPREVLIAVTAEGRYVIGKQALADRSVDAVAAGLRAAAKAGSDSVVIISADAAAPHQAVVTVMEAAPRQPVADHVCHANVCRSEALNLATPPWTHHCAAASPCHALHRFTRMASPAPASPSNPATTLAAVPGAAWLRPPGSAAVRWPGRCGRCRCCTALAARQRRSGAAHAGHAGCPPSWSAM